MKTAEQFKELLARYCQRDEETKDEYEDFISEKSEVSMKRLFESLPSVEEKFKLKLPDEYKAFVEAAYSWGMWGKSNEFNIYNEQDIYEFNYIGSHQGRSSFEELKDYFMFGQDTGEKSYFFDPFNKLGYGIDAVWRIDRCTCNKRDFELVAKDFYELAEKFCNEEDEHYEQPFENERGVQDGISINQFLADNVESNPALMEKINMTQEKIAEYFKILKSKDSMARVKRIWNADSENEVHLNVSETKNFPPIVFYLVVKYNYLFNFGRHSIITQSGESLLEENYGRYAMKILKDMFVFATVNKSILSKDIDAFLDYFFIDTNDKLGNGSEAVYIICTKSKRLEEACHVAKDIVDLFRIFAEGEELNTTPIGKAK